LGASHNAVPIEAIRIGNGPNTYLFVGGIHAGMAPSTVMLAEELAAYYEKNPDEIPSHATLYFIPSLNPDSPHAPRSIAGRLNANGVDINRNWGCAWEEDVFLGGELYEGAGGSAPFSEPETMALKEFIEQIEPEGVIFWDAPINKGIVSYGVGCNSESPSSQLGLAYATAASYTLDKSSPDNIPGDVTNWLSEQGVPAAFVIIPQASNFNLEDHINGVDAVLASISIPSFERTLYLEQPFFEGDDVRLVQHQLADLGYLEAESVDGVYDINSKNAVEAFQKDRELDVDGVVGPKSWYSLFAPENE